MSDVEANSPSKLKEEIDDFFGDDENIEVEEEDETPKDNETYLKSETEDIPFGQGEYDQSGSDRDDYDEDNSEKNILELSLPRHAVSLMTEGTQLLKTPMHLNIDPHPFDPITFKEEVETNELERVEKGLTSKQIYNEKLAEKLINETTVRWRYHNSGNDEIVKQSNAHFVQWDDGTISLKIGNEMFDVKTLPVADNYLVKSYKTAEILQTDSIVENTINLLPASSDSIHKRLTQVMKNIHFKDKILNTTTEDDPLKKQRIADENERKRMKMKRQLESRRRLEEEKFERGESPAMGVRESSYARFARTYGDEDDNDGIDGEEYDEEDDFVAGDEEELEQYDDEDEEEGEGGDDNEDEEFEKGAERLRKLKEEGQAKYRESSAEEETRKRRRIIESDEDE